jgi:hypothetical protein
MERDGKKEMNGWLNIWLFTTTLSWLWRMELIFR